MSRNLVFGFSFFFFFLTMLFQPYNFFYIDSNVSVGTRVFLNCRSSSRKSQNQQKPAEKITDFTIPFRSKSLTLFTNLNSLDVENNMQQKAFLA